MATNISGKETTQPSADSLIAQAKKLVETASKSSASSASEKQSKELIAGDGQGTNPTGTTDIIIKNLYPLGDDNARPGDIAIGDIQYTTVDSEAISILHITKGIEIWESLFSPVLSGRLVIEDTDGLIDALPMTTFDMVEIWLKSPRAEEKYLRFVVGKIGGRTQKNQNTYLYTLELISYESYLASTNAIAKTYSGKYSEMVEEMFRDQFIDKGSELKTLFTEPTENEGILYVPYWNIFKAMSFCANRAMPDTGSKLPTYFFYETTQGYNFKAVENFYKNEPIQDYWYTALGASTKNTGTAKYSEVVDKALELVIPDSGAGLDLLASGAFGAKLWIKDTNSADVKQNEYTYKEYRDLVMQYIGGEDGIKPPYDAWGNDLEGSAQYRAYTQISYIDDNVEDVLKYIDWELFRNAFITEITHINIKIKVYGSMALNVGDIINFHFIKADSIVGSIPVEDKHWSGKYFVSGIRHVINSDNKHMMNVQLSKNFYTWSEPTGPKTDEGENAEMKVENGGAETPNPNANPDSVGKSEQNTNAKEQMLEEMQNAINTGNAQGFVDAMKDGITKMEKANINTK